jgi:hypothetical protein
MKVVKCFIPIKDESCLPSILHGTMNDKLLFFPPFFSSIYLVRKEEEKLSLRYTVLGGGGRGVG